VDAVSDEAADAEVGIIPDPLADDPTVEIGILLIFVNY